MKKTLLTLVAIMAVVFTGCSSKGVATTKKTGLEGTKINAYFIGKYTDIAAVKSKLEMAGFEIIADYASVKKGTTILYTNAAIKAEAAKPGRAFAAVLRLFVDDKEKIISFTNPIYFAKAFMQDDYNHTVFNRALQKINTAFPGLKASSDALLFDDLAKYRFMMGMPCYKEVYELGKPATTTAELVEKVKNYKKGREVIFSLKLSETSTIVALDLSKRTKKFVTKIGRANAAILPWIISIENGKAKALHAKYYIALSYPLLDMGGFMKIATVPGAISRELEKPFKK